MIHFFLINPLLLTHKICLFANELSDSLATNRHVLIWIFLSELDNMVVIRMRSLIQIKEILAHVWQIFEELKNCDRIYMLLVFYDSLSNQCFSQLDHSFCF